MARLGSYPMKDFSVPWAVGSEYMDGYDWRTDPIESLATRIERVRWRGKSRVEHEAWELLLDGWVGNELESDMIGIFRASMGDLIKTPKRAKRRR